MKEHPSTLSVMFPATMPLWFFLNSQFTIETSETDTAFIRITEATGPYGDGIPFLRNVQFSIVAFPNR